MAREGLPPTNDHEAVATCLRLVEQAQAQLREAQRVAGEFGLRLPPGLMGRPWPSDHELVLEELNDVVDALALPWYALFARQAEVVG